MLTLCLLAGVTLLRCRVCAADSDCGRVADLQVRSRLGPHPSVGLSGEGTRVCEDEHRFS
jgi:hypothetical protein